MLKDFIYLCQIEENLKYYNILLSMFYHFHKEWPSVKYQQAGIEE